MRALIDEVTTRAARRGEGAPCLAWPDALTGDAATHALADGRLAGLVIGRTGETMVDPRIGTQPRAGDWRLPNGDYQVIYLVGSARRLSRAMLREAARHGVRAIAVQVAGRWINVPLGPLIRLKAPVRWIAARAWWARDRIAAMGGGSADGRLEAAFRALIAARPAGPYAPVPGRIVLVIGSLSPGGAERQAAMTAAALKAAGRADVRLLCHTLAGGPPHHHDFHRARAEAAGVVVGEIERRAARDIEGPDALIAARGAIPGDLRADIANLQAAFSALKPAVVHAWLDWDGVRAGIAAVLAGVPRVVVSGRNLNPSRFVFHQPTMRPAYRVLIDHPSVRFLNNSRAGADDYAAWLGVDPARIAVIANAVAFEGLDPPTAREERAARARHGLPIDGPVIGGVFRLAPEKRPLLWLEMAARLARLRPDARFILFGIGPLETALRKRAARLGLMDRLHFAGVTPRIAEAMAAIDILVLASRDEGLPNVVLEAQALGRPVITTRAGGVAEAMRDGETGLIIDPATPEALAGAVDRVLDDANWRERARAIGPAFTRNTFSVERMVKATLDVYEGGNATDKT